MNILKEDSLPLFVNIYRNKIVITRIFSVFVTLFLKLSTAFLKVTIKETRILIINKENIILPHLTLISLQYTLFITGNICFVKRNLTICTLEMTCINIPTKCSTNMSFYLFRAILKLFNQDNTTSINASHFSTQILIIMVIITHDSPNIYLLRYRF